MEKRTKNAIFFALKVLVAGVLITLLVRSKSLDFGALKVLFENPLLFLGNFVCWLLSGVILAVTRWRLLLRLAGARVPLGRALMLQLTAIFFNVVIPGSVGGDFVKALYVARDEAPEKRTTIVLIAFLERFLGLAGLVGFCTIVTLFRLDVLWPDPNFRPMVITVGFLACATIIGPAIGVLAVRRWGDRVEKLFGGGTSFVARMGRQLVASARLVAAGPLVLLGALGLSMTTHACGITLFIALTRTITGQDVTYGQLATVYPMGILSLVLPISPGGFGVGHLAFDRLFAAVGLTGGATVFNVFLLGQLSPSVIGVIPYLALRRSLPKGEEETKA
jgi:uncharacterized membrane protein YbhN (UPF0104 family)